MAERKKRSTKFETLIDFEAACRDIERDLINTNKALLAKMLGGFRGLTKLLEQNESSVYPVVIKWFTLYLKFQTFVDPKNEKLLEQFEKTVPTAISYVIGCLQFNTKDYPNFHYNLLTIIDTLLQNIPINVLEQTNFTNGTISCIWKPICFAGDFNTQTLALKIFATLLKTLDTAKQEDELKTIKWASLNLFRDKLNRVIDGTKHVYVFENACRDLLNNFNMTLSKNILIYSLYCKSLLIGNRYEMFKPLYLDKFWVDINYRSNTISFKGRHKFDLKLGFEDVNVEIKWVSMKLESDCLFIAVNKPNESTLPTKVNSLLKIRDNIKIYLTAEEEQRLKENKPVMEFIHTIDNDENLEEYSNKSPESNKSTNLGPINKLPESNKSTYLGPINHLPQTPLTSRNIKNAVTKQYSLRQQYPKRKFFSYLEEDDKPIKRNKKDKKRKMPDKKPRILKPRSNRTSICKVIPVVVDLTRTPDKIKTTHTLAPESNNVINLEQFIMNGDECRINDNQCSSILEKLTNNIKDPDVYNYKHENVGISNRSYRNCFAKLSNNADESNTKMEQADVKKSLVLNSKTASGSNKKLETTKKNAKNSNRNKRKILSENIFDQLINEANTTPTRPIKMSRLSNKKSSQPDIKIDLTFDDNKENEEPHHTTYDDVRFSERRLLNSTPLFSPPSFPKTPTSTNAMNISDIINTPIATNTPAADPFLSKDSRTKTESNSLFGNEKIEEILNDWQTFSEEVNADCELENNDEFSNLKNCVIYRKRLDSNVSASGSEDCLQDCKELKDTNDQVSAHFIVPSANHIISTTEATGKVTLTNSNILQTHDATMPLEETLYKKSLDNEKDRQCKNSHSNCNNCKNIGHQLSTHLLNHFTSVTETGIETNIAHITPSSTTIEERAQFDTKETVIVTDLRSTVVYKDIANRQQFLHLHNGNTITDNNNLSSKDFPIDKFAINSKLMESLCRNFIRSIQTDYNMQLDNNDNCKGISNNILKAVEKSNLISEPKTYESEFRNMLKTNYNLEINAAQRTRKANGDLSIAINSNNLAGVLKTRNTDENRNISRWKFQALEDGNKEHSKHLNQVNVEQNSNESQHLSANANQVYMENKLNESQHMANYNIYLHNSQESSTSVTSFSNKFKSDEFFMKDLSELKNIYDTQLQTKFNNILRQFLTNSFDENKCKMCEISEQIVNDSMKHRQELAQLRMTMESLLRQMEYQYEAYRKKSKQFESYHNEAERILDAFGHFNIQTAITNEYKDVMDQFVVGENILRQNIWQTYNETYKLNMLREISSLSDI